MRIFTILLLFFFIAADVQSQTVTQTDGKRAFSKKYFFPKSADYNTWDISGHFGITYPYTDISASSKRNFALGIDVTKFISHTFALQARFMRGTISGIDEYNPEYSFSTTFDYDITLNAIVQFGNISFIEKNKKLSAYATIGFGVIHFSPDVYTDGGYVSQKGLYSQYTQPLVPMDYSSTTNIVVPLGVGLKYRVSDRVSINMEYSYRATNSDKLDGFYKLLSSHDNFSYFSAGAIYHLGKQREVLEWVNPMEIVYDDMNELKTKIIQLTLDTDMDGVPDVNDREPETPAGNKVYGDGTSVTGNSGNVQGNNYTKPPVVRETVAAPVQVEPAKTDNVSQTPVSTGMPSNPNEKTIIQDNSTPSGAVIVPLPDMTSGNKPAESASDLKAGEVKPATAGGDVTKSGVITTQDDLKKDTVVQYIPDLVEPGKPIDSVSKSKIVLVPDEITTDSATRINYLFPEKSTVADSIYRSRVQVLPVTPQKTETKTPPVTPAKPAVVENKPVVAAPVVSGGVNNAPGNVTPASTIDSTLLQNYNDLPSIYFTVDETKIGEKQLKTLEYVGMVMQSNPSVNFTVIGICDGSGSLKYNIALGKKRAEAVVKYLVSNFQIDTNRLSIMTLGAVDSSVKGSAQLNRRVDIKVRN